MFSKLVSLFLKANKECLMMCSSETVSAHSEVANPSRFSMDGSLSSGPVRPCLVRWCVRLRSTEHVALVYDVPLTLHVFSQSASNV